MTIEEIDKIIKTFLLETEKYEDDKVYTISGRDIKLLIFSLIRISEAVKERIPK